MSIDVERVTEYFQELMDRYEAVELVELLGLTTEEILIAFEEQVLEKENLLNADRQ